MSVTSGTCRRSFRNSIRRSSTIARVDLRQRRVGELLLDPSMYCSIRDAAATRLLVLQLAICALFSW